MRQVFYLIEQLFFRLHVNGSQLPNLSKQRITVVLFCLLQPPPSSLSKRPRTTEDFLLFCKFILDYENYEMLRHEVYPTLLLQPSCNDNLLTWICCFVYVTGDEI